MVGGGGVMMFVWLVRKVILKFLEFQIETSYLFKTLKVLMHMILSNAGKIPKVTKKTKE